MTRTAISPSAPAAPAAAPADLLARAEQHLQLAVDHLLTLQAKPGYWCAELEGDSILQSEYILLKWILGEENHPDLPWIANYLRAQQRPEDGAWVQYPGAKPDVSATVKGYYALKLMGDDPRAPHMTKARDLVLRLGGAEKINSFSKFYLAALGQVSYDAVPSIPPEIVYLPKWFYFHLDKVSAWTRTMIQPLAIVTSCRAKRPTPLRPDQGLDELFVSQRDRHRLLPGEGKPRNWSRVFLSLDKILKLVDRAGMTPLRRRALKRVEDWIVSHTGNSAGLGAIFPPMVYIHIALRAIGYKPDHPVLVEAEKHLDDLKIRDPENKQIRIQPCHSPIWDTGIAAYALTDAGFSAAAEPMRRCEEWLLAKECREAGDWVANVKYPVAPSGWFFEYENAFYPDVDDTAMVAMALQCIGTPQAKAAAKRGGDWLLAMQNDDGGWAAFDRGAQNRHILEYVPFADHNAIQDPSCADITGRTLECLSHLGYRVDHAAVQAALAFLQSKQEPEGCWIGRWGVNYIYGTWQAICGLNRIGQDMNAPWVQRAGQWLRSVQQRDGSFGETADTYEDPSLKGQGPPTASQTAWGTMGLMSIYGPHDPAVKAGVAWLCRTQLPSGTWAESWFTGTGFPKVFYLRYHLYRLYFPLMCIGRWRRLSGASAGL